MNRTAGIVFVLLGIFFIPACGKKKPQIVTVPVEVQVPVPVKATPPPELLAAITPPLPVFVAPSSPDASSALTVEGERMLRGLIEDLLQRLNAWKAWATAP